MIGIVDRIKGSIPSDCQPCDCEQDNCSVITTDVPHYYVVVNVDCEQVKGDIRGKRCDCLFVGEHLGRTWVVPIELKTGKVEPSEVRNQLQGCARFVEKFVTDEEQIDFIPVLAHAKDKPIRKREFQRLGKRSITILKGKIRRQPKVIQCGDSLTKVLP